MKMNLQNIESYLLLYIDNELSAADRTELELFIQENPSVADELTILNQTIVTPETILFEDKVLLYRHDEMDASLPSSFKQSLYREEAKVVNGFFTINRLIGLASIAAMLLLLIGYRIYFDDPLRSKKEMSAHTNSPIKSKNGRNFIPVAKDIIENNALAKHKIKTIVVPESKMYTSNEYPLTKEANFIQQETKLTGAIVMATEINRNSKIIENSIVPVLENAVTTNIGNTNPDVNNNNNNTSEVEVEEDFNNINTDNNGRGVYIANFEIDGEKLRGISRRFNALFKRNKNDKQK